MTARFLHAFARIAVKAAISAALIAFALRDVDLAVVRANLPQRTSTVWRLPWG